MRERSAGAFVRLGRYVQSLAVAVLHPGDLMQLGQTSYATRDSVNMWSDAELVDEGLHPQELEQLEAITRRDGDLLALGMGGGRDAIALARLGFSVTGVDYIPGMVAQALENARRRGVPLQGMVQDINQLDVAPNSFDIVWLGALYSAIPTRAARVRLAKRIARALRPGGYLELQYLWQPELRPALAGELLGRFVALCTSGNRGYERGDAILGGRSYFHVFFSEALLRAELSDGGFELVKLHVWKSVGKGGAVCRKARQTQPGGAS